jgi:hypothetical protein
MDEEKEVQEAVEQQQRRTDDILNLLMFLWFQSSAVEAAQPRLKDVSRGKGCIRRGHIDINPILISWAPCNQRQLREIKMNSSKPRYVTNNDYGIIPRSMWHVSNNYTFASVP